MKAHVLLPTASHRRPSPRRVSASKRPPSAAPRRSRPARHGAEVSPARTYTPPVCTATGFLIPRLSPAVPLAYEGQFPGGLAHIQALVQHGALTLTSEGTTVEALIEQGIEALTHPGILNFELQWGEYYRVTVSEQGIAFIVDSAPHRWQLRLRPIITRLTPAEGAAFVAVLNESVVQGPCCWDGMAQFFGGELFDHSEEEARAARDDTPESSSLQAQGECIEDGSRRWLASLFSNYPALRGVVPDGEQLLLPPIAEPLSDDGLRALLAAFVAAHTAVLAAGLVGDIALMVTSWDRHCPISHAHDFHDQQISNGDWDAPEGVPFEEPWSRTIAEFARNINLVGEFIAAAQNLEEWTNAHC